jgi:acyl carrier protein
MSNETKAVFTEILELDADVDWSGVRYQVTPGWDSVAHMAIVGELEDRFSIMLETDDVIDMSSFERAIAILEKHGIESA